MATPAALQSSATNEWFTPVKYIEAARATMGGIDLDPASCTAANWNVQARQYFTSQEDSLPMSWYGRVWLNPPYGKTDSKSNQAIWSAKLVSEHCAGRVVQAVLLVNAQTAEKWFQPLWAFDICFTDHRIKFLSLGGKKSQPTHGNAFVYFGANRDEFYEYFHQFGHIVRGGC